MREAEPHTTSPQEQAQVVIDATGRIANYLSVLLRRPEHGIPDAEVEPVKGAAPDDGRTLIVVKSQKVTGAMLARALSNLRFPIVDQSPESTG